MHYMFLTGPALEIFFVAGGAAYVVLVRQKRLFIPKWLIFSSQCCLVNTQLFFSFSSHHTFSFLMCCNTTLEPVKACHWLYCAISAVCSITMEHFKCDPKVVRMALCEVQSLSHVTLIWCEATTWDLCDPHWLSLLIWSVLSQIFKRMFKGPV